MIDTKAEGLAENGVPPEEDQWGRVGWAPRFGNGETESMKDEPTLLDHQTFLEGRLDEKFFGGKKFH